MTETPTRTSSAVEIIARVVGDDDELRRMIAEESLNARVARLIREARTEAGLTQRDLAQRIGTTQSAIARLECADYEGHSLAMLQRIAAALHLEIDVRFVRVEQRVA